MALSLWGPKSYSSCSTGSTTTSGSMMIGTTCCKLATFLSKLCERIWLNNGANRYREAAICEARYPYMRDDNDSMEFDPNRDYFRRPELSDKDVGTHMAIYSIRHND